MVTRSLNLLKLLGKNNSAFLFGARGVGKTHLAQAVLPHFPHVKVFDLLKSEEFERYLRTPHQLRLELEHILKKRSDEKIFVFIDEIQKVPSLLDEVHSLLESHRGRVQFLMTGSSARKLRRSGVNLLGGRALDLKLFPLTSSEFEVDLSR